MESFRRRAEELVARPAESLNVELKRWLSLADDAQVAKLVRALMALRNRNGGFLVIGFDDKTRDPDPQAPADPKSAFDAQDLQLLVGRHSSEPFEVQAEFVERDGVFYPVIAVEAGVRVPVAVKSPIGAQGSKALLALGEVPFRTLNANYTPSTAAAGPRDWRDLLEICFENREADIGRFLRRQLASPDGLTALREMLDSANASSQRPSLRERCEEARTSGAQRFGELTSPGFVEPELVDALGMRSWEASLVLDPRLEGVIADQIFLDRLLSSNPAYSGWPVFGDTRGFSREDFRPVRRGGAWEYLVVERSYWTMLDYVRLEPSGRFYERRLLEDDASAAAREAMAGKVLDPAVVVDVVAEVMAVGLAYGRVLCQSLEGARLGCLFRWNGLAGRRLGSWTGAMMLPLANRSHDDSAYGYHEVALDVPDSALAPHVKAITAELFASFDGYSIPLGLVEQRVSALLRRRGS